METRIQKWCEDILGSSKRIAIPIMTHPGIELTGATVFDAVTDGEIHYRAIKALHERYHTSAITMIMDLTVEAEAFGCKINFERDGIPTVRESLIRNMEEADRPVVPDLSSSGRALEYLKAAKLAADHIREVPVFPGCIGPFSLAGRLCGMTEIMTSIYLYPDFTHRLLEKCTSFITGYVKAYKSIGADGVIMAEPAAGLLGEDECNQFSSAYIEKIADIVQDDRFMVVLHNCGHHGVLAKSMASTGSKALHFGNAADMVQVLKEVPEDILVMGNIDPVNVIQTKRPELIKQRVRKLLEQTREYPNFILSSGCDIPAGVPQENIAAFFDALDEYNQKK